MKEVSQIVYGLVIEALPASTFKVKLDNSEEIVRAYLSGKMRQNRIKVICGDRVSVEMTPYDIGKGRISRRL